MPVGRRCLQAFPELLFSDATHKTNQENRPLITFGVKDAEGRVQVVIRAWAPNERAWMFRWLFQTALPAIIGKATCERIRLVVTDGDSQELTQLDAAISSVFTNSKALLLSHVNSDEVVKVIGRDNADNTVTFLRSHVFVHEQHFARCFYLDVRGFDAYSNTCLEGTNYGVKYCENRVLPNMSQAKATKVMINQDEDKFSQNRKKTSDAFHKKPLQARTNTSAHILPTAESMLQQAMVASESYISYRCCEHKWWVLYSGHRNLPFGTNFESFTHHSINIRFWTVYSLYAVVLDPSELNEDELNIRNKLVMTSDQLLLHFEALMKNKLSILNYKIEHVENAVAIMEKHQGNAVGMTQEMHNCSAEFSFVGPGDETSDTPMPVGSHELLNPLYKELTQLCDVAGKDKAAKTARDLESLIIALKKEIASEQSPPTGKVVSCMVSTVSRKTKHVKQSKY
ncbi:MULE transposase domain containing protein [Nitzschia inconspicua]|uniref:MULE transposase domain containing protein n=1 Tax=Nitzschia inconspicua TaxID=303405 RepID=A0A9K3KK55_9STRA|nr:MULE transposase domain containing protein [Nitzschia inconspicua]